MKQKKLHREAVENLLKNGRSIKEINRITLASTDSICEIRDGLSESVLEEIRASEASEGKPGPKPDGSRRINISGRVSPDTKKIMNEAAKERNLTDSKIINEALELWVKNERSNSD